MTFQSEKRPFVTLKWAESADGFLDVARTSPDISPVVFSNAVTAARVHKLRAESAAILVGTNTALLDNPSLTVRRWSGKSPIRLVIDRERKIPASYHLLDDTIPTIVFTIGEKKKIGQTEYIPLDFRISIVHQILQCLFERQLNSLMVEGGSIMLQQFLDSGYWDRAIVEESPLTLGAGVKAPVFTFGQQSFDSFGGHIFRIYTHHRK